MKGWKIKSKNLNLDFTLFVGWVLTQHFILQSEVGKLMAHKKVNLPQKICPVCQRPFTWRKKWERDWEQVTYCSEKCRRGKVNNEY